MIALVLEIGPRLGLVALLAVAIVTYGGYMGAWRGERRRSRYSFRPGDRDDQAIAPTQPPSDGR
jgi:hypothetical protein